MTDALGQRNPPTADRAALALAQRCPLAGSEDGTRMKALIVSADRFEDSELLEPARRLRDEGVEVDIASTRRGVITGKHGHRVEVDKTVEALAAADYDLLLLPGGQAPAGLRRDAAVLQLVRSFVAARKPVAAICHGPQILAAAGVLRGRHMTGYRAVAGELQAAGAVVEDREVVVDDRLITSRTPADLPAFMDAVMRMLRPA
jgi:protease I